MKALIFLILFPLFVLASYQEDLQKLSTSRQSDSVRLEKLFKLNWYYRMQSSPEWATSVGYPGQNANWTDLSLPAIDERKRLNAQTLKVVQKISRAKLKESQKLSYDLFLHLYEETVEGAQYPEEYLVLNQMGGVHQGIVDALMTAPKNSKADFADMIQRLEKTPKLITENQVLLTEGIKRGILQAKVVLVGVPKQFDDILKPNIEDSPLYKAFLKMPTGISPEDQEFIRHQAKQDLQNIVYPALRNFRDFLVKTYIPACRENVSLSSLPNGASWYALKTRHYTTTRLTPDEVHEIGLKEVARIRAEMEKIKNKVKFNGDLKRFEDFLKTDSQFYYQSPQELMIGFRDIAKRIDPELPRFFGRLPRLTYGVREIPSYRAETAPTGYYEDGSPEAGRAGVFFTNTFNLKARPKWQMEALTLHEAVPGHHLQISLAQEIDGLPEFRKKSGITAFVEGWGLYSESLGDELGFYQDPYSKYGQLTFEIWRAIRLVVDTGLHAKGWTRDQVLQYFRDNSPISEQQIVSETDRYIAHPGQALAYKMGELRFKAIRKAAEQKLGDKFNIREFHDAVLSEGALPMDLLEKRMDQWIQTQSSQVH